MVKLGGRFLQSLLFMAVFSTFVTNVLFILKSSYDLCKENISGFPWERSENMADFSKRREKIEEFKQDRFLDRALAVADQKITTQSKDYERQTLTIEVYSSRRNISVTVNGKKLLHGNSPSLIGINALVINQETGLRMGTRAFDTFGLEQEAQLLQEFVKDVTAGRIICFSVQDEASLHLKKSVRAFLKHLGSAFINRLGFRDMWAFVIQKKSQGSSRVLGEAYQRCTNAEGKRCVFDGGNKWAPPVDLVVTFLSEKSRDACTWEDTPSNRRRREFCNKYEGYPTVCSCTSPRSIDLSTPAFEDGTRFQIPIAVMAGNRPQYLFRMLTSLQNVIGLDDAMVTVYIDGFFNEARSVAELFGLKVIQHEENGKLAGRIAQHYKKSLSTSFDSHPEAQYLAILEEDLELSVDILSYFKQLLPVLEKDKSLFCISAWNDQGYEHVVNDPAMLYRIETMPGLGWVLSREIYKGELEKKWPAANLVFDWDMWVRLPENMKERECIIPDISRTFHFGAKGMNVGSFMQSIYFQTHAFNTVPNVKLDVSIMENENYEKEIKRLISLAEILNHSKTPCSDLKTFIPDTVDKTYIFYIRMDSRGDYTTWLNVARCFRIWDLDARGFHRGMFRLWYKKNHLIIVGCPWSTYCSLKPEKLVPINMQKQEKRPPSDR